MTDLTLTETQWRTLASALADAIDYRINDAEGADAQGDEDAAQASRDSVIEYDALLALLKPTLKQP